MMGRKTYHYEDVSWSRRGLMRCGCCGKLISEGQYRYRETSDRYITHHRACTPKDPNWARLDKEARLRSLAHQELVADARAFYEKHGVTDLSDYLDQDGDADFRQPSAPMLAGAMAHHATTLAPVTGMPWLTEDDAPFFEEH